jgi:uncharacterized membrane protein YhaH (DUF805 family)
MKGMIVLGIISALLPLVLFINVGLAIVMSIVSLVLYIPLIFMSIKRAHDSGKSGWLSIIAVVLLFAISMVIGMVLSPMFVGGVDTAALEAAGESGDLGAVMEAAGAAAKATAIPSAISSIVAFLATAFVFNLINKQDPGDNQYGPVPAA